MQPGRFADFELLDQVRVLALPLQHLQIEFLFAACASLCCKARDANGLDPADFSRVSRADRVRALVRGGAIVACETTAAQRVLL